RVAHKSRGVSQAAARQSDCQPACGGPPPAPISTLPASDRNGSAQGETPGSTHLETTAAGLHVERWKIDDIPRSDDGERRPVQPQDTAVGLEYQRAEGWIGGDALYVVV